NQTPGVVKPDIGRNVNFEIKSQFMGELSEDTFSRNKNNDAHKHVERILDIVNLFKIPRLTHDRVMLRVFPITLTRAAKRWTAKQLEEIHNFKQKGDETLNQAWQRYNDLLYKCLTYDLNSHQKDSPGRDMKNLKKNVHAIQVGCKTCGGSHLDKECPLHKEVKSIKEVKYGEFGRSFLNNIGNMARYHFAKDFQAKSANEVFDSIIGHCKAIYASDEAPRDETSSDGTNKLHGVSFISDDDVHVPEKTDEGPSKVLPCQLPPKELSPESFTLPYTIGNLNLYAMAGLGASVNIMPISMFNHTKLKNLKKTDMLVEMADMTKKAPIEIVENSLVKIDKLLFPFDFMVINMLGDPNETMILGSPFLATIHVLRNGSFEFWPTCDPILKEYNMGDIIYVFDKQRNLLQWECYLDDEKRNEKEKELSFPKFYLINYGNEKIDNTIKARSDFFEEESPTNKDPYSRKLEDYKLVFDIEIKQLADEYKLGIGKKGYILDDIWEKCKQVYGGTLNSLHDHRFKEEDRWESGLDEKYYDPPQVCVETFEVKRYSFKEGKSFICVIKQLEDSLPLGLVNGSRFKEMIRKEMDTGGSVQRET
ncbi:7-deoxyloganetin glucosyltransferase-like protein, partial [Tanacetum coccineum]